MNRAEQAWRLYLGCVRLVVYVALAAFLLGLVALITWTLYRDYGLWGTLAWWGVPVLLGPGLMAWWSDAN